MNNPDPDNLCGRYILNDQGEPVPEPDLEKWCAAFRKNDLWRVGDETINNIRISTIFLRLNYNHCGGGPPILWETMLFADTRDHPLDQHMDRCAGSREQAEAMHARMVKWVKNQKVQP